MLHLRPFKNAWVFGLGLLLAFQAAGWYMSWSILMLDAKITATKTLAQPLEPVRQCTIAVQDLKHLWVGKREIRYGGRLYDVRRQVVQGDSVRLEIYHDAHEEALLRQLSQLLATGKDDVKFHFQWLSQLLVASYLLPVLPDLPVLPGEYVPCTGFSYQLICAQQEPAQQGPPPKF